jgi:hypothetical protein
MANVAPPRFVRNPGPGPELGPALCEAFGVRRDRVPALIAQVLEKLERIG